MDNEEQNSISVPGAATEEELLLFFSGVMRGQLADSDREIAVGDRLKAGTALQKLFEDRAAESAAGGRELAIARASERIGQNIAPAFAPVFGDVLVHGHTHYDLAGGRGSMKSSFVSLTVVYLLLLHPDIHALVLRKISNTMRDSVYAQYIWALDMLDVAPWFDCRIAPMELVFRPTGQKILFRGADDPMKIKSIKAPFGSIAVTHFEEKDQFAGRHEIRTILQSTMRGGELFWNFESYNPPISAENWANLDSAEERPDRLCHRSSYLEAPAEWLGEAFYAEAEALRRTDERAWRHEYLGEAVGTGGNVFENLELRTITDGEAAGFDRIYMGVDWGFAPDPFAFVRLHYDAARETIWLLDELVVQRQTNSQTAEELLNRGYTDTVITCDSAEPKSVADYRSCGLSARKAVKGPGSVEYGMKWLQGRRIVIDKARTPNAWREFSRYEFERDREGNFVSGYPDRDNHTIDAVRYALERVYGRYRSRA